MIRMSRAPRALAAAGLVLAVLAGCDDSTAPGAPLDARLAADRVAMMVETAEALEDAFLSMEAADDLFASEAAARLAAGGLVPDLRAARGYVAAQGSVPGTAAFFPFNFLGVTFAWDAEQGRYVATDAEGAPEDGIRILYYAVDPFTGEPQADAQLGHIDLRDLGTAVSERLAVRVVDTGGAAPVTLAEYGIDVRTEIGQTHFGVIVSADGYLSNGIDRLDFDLSETVSLTETDVRVGQDFFMALAGSTLSVRYVVDASGSFADPESGAGELVITVRNQGQVAVFELAIVGDALDGRVLSGGEVVAVVGGTTGQPEFTNPTGAPLDPDEVEALKDLFAVVELLAVLVNGIFPPA